MLIGKFVTCYRVWFIFFLQSTSLKRVRTTQRACSPWSRCVSLGVTLCALSYWGREEGGGRRKEESCKCMRLLLRPHAVQRCDASTPPSCGYDQPPDYLCSCCAWGSRLHLPVTISQLPPCSWYHILCSGWLCSPLVILSLIVRVRSCESLSVCARSWNYYWPTLGWTSLSMTTSRFGILVLILKCCLAKGHGQRHREKCSCEVFTSITLMCSILTLGGMVINIQSRSWRIRLEQEYTTTRSDIQLLQFPCNEKCNQ